MKCPGEQNEFDWLWVTNQLGEEAAVRLFKKYEHLEEPDTAMRNALDPAKYTATAKAKRLESHSENLERVETTVDQDGDPIRIYQNTSTKVQYDAVSNQLDRKAETIYRGESVGERYADQGTKIHKVWEDIIRHNSSINQAAELNPDVPKIYIKKAHDFVAKLKETGKVLTEVKVSIDATNATAGTADIIHLRDDGIVDIYDIKTAHQTSSKKKGGLWDLQKNTYKAKRYSTQLMMYGEMVGNILDHPVKNHYILPAEVLYKDADAETLEVSKVNFKDPELIDNYDYTFGAQRIVDEILGIKKPVDLDLAAKGDPTNTILSDITKLDKSQLTNEQSMRAEAEVFLQQVESSGTKSSYVHPISKKTVLFKSTDRAARLNQIMRDVIEVKRAGKNDLFASLLSFIKTGKDVLTENERTVIPALVNEYRASGFRAEDISTIDGFANKANWLVLRNGDRVDLMYAGGENLNTPLPNNANHLLGALSSQPQQKYQIKLGNTYRELFGMEGTLIALQLMKDNPSINIGKISLYSENQGTLPAVVNWNRYLDVLEIIQEKHDLDGPSGGQLTELMKTDRSRFKIDYIESYMDFMGNLDLLDEPKLDQQTGPQKSDESRRVRMQDKLDEFKKGRYQKEMLRADLARNIMWLKDKSPEVRTKAQQRELEILSAIYLQVHNVDLMDEPVSKWESRLQSNTLLPGNIMNFVRQTIFKQTNSIGASYFDFNNKMSGLITDFFKSQGYSKYNPADKVVSQTTRFYEDLFERRKMIDAQTGEAVTVNAYRLIREDSKEFQQKTGGNMNHPFAKFHQFLKNQIAVSAARAGMKNKWDPYQLPLVKSSVSNSLYKAFRGETTIGEAGKLWAKRLTDNFEFTAAQQDSRKEGVWKVSNWFYMQTDPAEMDNMMGVSGNQINDLNKYNSFETNLEKVMNLFYMNGLRIAAMEEVSQAMAVAHTVYGHMEANLYGNDFMHNRKLMESLHTIIVENKSLQAGETIDKVATALNMIATHLTLAGNVKSALTVFGGQEMLVFSRALSNQMGKTGYFDVASVRKATALMAKKSKFGMAMVDYWKAQDADTTSLTSGVRQTGNKSWLGAKTLFSMFVAADRVTKGQLILAQMIKDGSIDAYSMDKEGKITYNEDKDPRFQTADGQALKAAMKRQMADDGTLDENNRMTTGYDSNQHERLITEISILFGTYERDQKAVEAFSAIGKLFFLFKSFFPSVYFRGVNRNINLSNLGNYKKVRDQNGDVQMVWEGGSHEGVLVSLLATFRYLTKLKGQREPLTAIQKQNLKRITADMITLSIGTGFAYAWAAAFGDDEDVAWAKAMSILMAGAQRDLLVVYNIDTVVDAFKPVAIEVTLNSVKKLGNSLWSTGTKGNTDFFEEALRVPAVTRQLDTYIKEFEQTTN